MSLSTEVEGEIIEVTPPNALAAMARAEVDVQISAAHAYPRSIKRFRAAAIEMATLDQETAASCFYSLPRDGKRLEGPSVRLAEIAASAWGNIRHGSRVIDDDGRFITAQGVCHDLQTNNATSIEVKRRVTNKQGRRFSDDMIAVTGNAAASIALRNAILRIIPRCYIDQLMVEARKVAVGDQKTLSTRRQEMMTHFVGKLGIPQDRVFAAVGKAGLEDIGLDELFTLKGIATAIKEGATNIDEAFPTVQQIAAPGAVSIQPATKTEAVSQKLSAPIEHPPQQPRRPRRELARASQKMIEQFNEHVIRLNLSEEDIDILLKPCGAATFAEVLDVDADAILVRLGRLPTPGNDEEIPHE